MSTRSQVLFQFRYTGMCIRAFGAEPAAGAGVLAERACVAASYPILGRQPAWFIRAARTSAFSAYVIPCCGVIGASAISRSST